MHLSTEIQTFLEKGATKSFLIIANDFVKLLEEEQTENNNFVSLAHDKLIELYIAGQKLEQIELKYSSHQSDFEPPDSEYFLERNKSLISLLGKDTFYWKVFDPTYSESDGNPDGGWKISDKEASQGWLVDDFADIYRDLKTGLEQMKIGTDEAIEDALWDMKWSFVNHWGNHCINAMRYLHFLHYEGKLVL